MLLHGFTYIYKSILTASLDPLEYYMTVIKDIIYID